MSNDTNLINLVRLIFAEADLSDLVDKGVRYSQISQLLEKAVNERYIEATRGKFIVTKKGIELIHKKPLKNKDNVGWIRPLDEMKTKQRNLMSIYLPTKSTARSLVSATSARGLHHREDESSS